MKIRLRISTASGRQIGNLRVSAEVFEKLDKLAKENGVSKQEVARAILDQIINEVEV